MHLLLYICNGLWVTIITFIKGCGHCGNRCTKFCWLIYNSSCCILSWLYKYKYLLLWLFIHFVIPTSIWSTGWASPCSPKIFSMAIPNLFSFFQVLLIAPEGLLHLYLPQASWSLMLQNYPSELQKVIQTQIFAKLPNMPLVSFFN